MNCQKNKVIEIENLNYSVAEKALLRSVSLCVHTGERIAVVGANGSGKTTLAKLLLGLVSPSEPCILYHGKQQESYSRGQISQLLSYVPQQLSETIPYSVSEFISMSRYIYPTGANHTQLPTGSIIQVTLKRCGIEHLADQPLYTLSGGERQKVSIAAALARETSIIILDEPTSQLDPSQSESVQQLLRDIDKNMTIIVITHDLNWAASGFDRILGMANGKVVADDVPKMFITEDNLQCIFKNSWPIHYHPQTGAPIISANI